METPSYRRTVEELRKVASMFWPADLSQKESEQSIIPTLLETQDQFIAILSIDVPSLSELFQLVDISSLSANLFLKHLVVLADFGGEMLQRVNRQFEELFPSRELRYGWKGKLHSYQFKGLPVAGSLSNDRLGISGKRLLEKWPFADLMKDVVAILVHGSAIEESYVAEVLARCEIGNYLGQARKLERFVKQRYICVSRITGGAKANTLGQEAQNYVKEYLENHLCIGGVWVKRDERLPGVTDRDLPTRFDIVVSDGNKYVAVEVSFQVTTNSTIERKAGQAQSRYHQAENAGHKIAYVLDGAGTFERENALGTLCSYSHCTVAFSQPELDVLCAFLREFFTSAAGSTV